MTSKFRWALPSLALAASLSLSFGHMPAAAAEGLYAQSGKVIALIRAGKYAEALPLAQAMVTQLEKGPPNKDYAGALNNLAQVYADMGRDAEAEPLYKQALAVMEKAVGLESVDIAIDSTALPRSISVSFAMPRPNRCSSVR